MKTAFYDFSCFVMSDIFIRWFIDVLYLTLHALEGTITLLTKVATKQRIFYYF